MKGPLNLNVYDYPIEKHKKFTLYLSFYHTTGAKFEALM